MYVFVEKYSRNTDENSGKGAFRGKNAPVCEAGGTGGGKRPEDLEMSAAECSLERRRLLDASNFIHELDLPLASQLTRT